MIVQPTDGVTGGTQSFTGAKTFATSLAVTTADTLTIGGVIVPQFVVVSQTLNVLNVSQALFVSDAAYQVVGIRAVWGVAGGAAAVLNIEKLTGTTVPGSGTAMLTGNFDLTSTANTVTSGTLSSTASDLQLAVGNRLGVKLGGVLTGLIGCCVTITLKRI